MQPNRMGLPNTAALRQSADEGGLWIDGLLVADGAPERCALRYERLADEVDAQVATLSQTAVIPGFGGLESGGALRTGFETKAIDALDQLRGYAGAARDLAAVFRAAGAGYREADQELAGAVGAIEVPGDGDA
ncbi:hypothetical protein ACFWU5_04455 [Nocardia sp. NPDC058640]|uniref:hypothetical protein n=1 Tax=Nocardia sp. NPDC058640 TaxID=3346571 RepID=UPI0036692FEE